MWITERKHADDRNGGASAATFEAYVSQQRELAQAQQFDTTALEEELQLLRTELDTCAGKRHLIRRRIDVLQNIELLSEAMRCGLH